MPKGKILVVDTSQASLLERIEAAIGESYQVAGVPSKEEAIQLIRKERFDLLITETRAGLGLVEAVRRSDPSIALVLLGNHQSIDSALQTLKSGPQAFLAYRFTASELERAIEDALERRRLVRDNKRLKALLPLFEISKTLLSEVKLGKLFDVILEIVWRETEADSVSLMLLDEGGQELVVKAALGPLQRLNNSEEGKGEVLAGWVAKTAKPLLLTEETPIDPSLKRAMTEMGASSVLCLPLVAKGGVIGVLRSSKTGGAPFNYSDLELLSILCGQAAIAIENARLFSRVKTQQNRVEQLLKQTTLAQEHERKRISLEVHDGAAQWMVAACYRIQALHKILNKCNVPRAGMELSEIKNLIDQSTKELRRVIVDLYPPALEELGLFGTLHQNLKNFENETGIACSFEIEGAPPSLPPISQIAIYRVTQEALANVRKHAQATEVDVILRFRGDELSLAIRDNGKGFDLCQVLGNARSAKNVGLLGMKDRAETLGGTIRMETTEGAGTMVTLTLPLSTSLPKELSPMAKMATG